MNADQRKWRQINISAVSGEPWVLKPNTKSLAPIRRPVSQCFVGFLCVVRSHFKWGVCSSEFCESSSQNSRLRFVLELGQLLQTNAGSTALDALHGVWVMWRPAIANRWVYTEMLTWKSFCASGWGSDTNQLSDSDHTVGNRSLSANCAWSSERTLDTQTVTRMPLQLYQSLQIARVAGGSNGMIKKCGDSWQIMLRNQRSLHHYALVVSIVFIYFRGRLAQWLNSWSELVYI